VSSKALLSKWHAVRSAMRRPIGRWAALGLFVATAAAPWALFFDPIAFTSSGHVVRDPLAIYRVYSDDFAYLAASRDLPRTIGNLFSPHNTHIVPAWRILTWMLSACAGSLERVPEVLAVASYAILIAVMILAGRLVARETASRVAGGAAAIGVGTTSLMLAPATWYSAGQPLWAGFATLAALWYAQCRRRSRSTAAITACTASSVFGKRSRTVLMILPRPGRKAKAKRATKKAARLGERPLDRYLTDLVDQTARRASRRFQEKPPSISVLTALMMSEAGSGTAVVTLPSKRKPVGLFIS
jgi:hypothetical protein